MSAETLHSASPNTILRSQPFDLVGRACLSIGAMTGLINPERGGQPYSYIECHTDPPIASHAPWDHGDSAGRILEALTLARIMTGSEPNEHDADLLKLLQNNQREDGMMEIPAEPWTFTAPVMELEWTPRGALMAWTTRYLALDDQQSRQNAAKLVHALHRNAIWDNSGLAWFPGSHFPANGWLDRRPPVDKMASILVGAQIIFPLIRFADATGNEEALSLAKGLVRFLKEKTGVFDPQGSMDCSKARHLHSAASFLKSALKVALMTNDDALRDWAKAGYECLRELGTDFGFFPHGTQGREQYQGDVAATKDMIELAIMLGQNVAYDYFADAERFGRNHLLESQLLGLDWINGEQEGEFATDLWCANHPPEGVTTDNVCDRVIGAFASWTQINDAFDPANPRLMLRSTGAGVRAMYDLWHYAVTREEGAVCVNLHFSRDTRWATVTSHVPDEGRIDVLMKTPGVLAVRVPAHLTSDQVDVIVNNKRHRHERLAHGYAWIEALQNGDNVSVTWQFNEHAEIYDMEGVNYTGYWRDDTLLRMNPTGKLSPLYGRPLETHTAPPRGASGSVREIVPL